MLMSYIIAGMVLVSAVFGALGGGMAEVSSAFLEGAGAAAELCIGMCGAVCVWSGVMEVMRQSGLSKGLAGLLSPLLRRIYPAAFRDRECADALAENFTANLLGLGNAATPAGICAAKRMKETLGEGSPELGRLVVMNTASVQLIPATVAAVRAACGARDPFDILPAVWCASLVSVAAGLVSAWALEGRE